MMLKRKLMMSSRSVFQTCHLPCCSSPSSKSATSRVRSDSFKLTPRNSSGRVSTMNLSLVDSELLFEGRRSMQNSASTRLSSFSTVTSLGRMVYRCSLSGMLSFAISLGLGEKLNDIKIRL